MVRTLRRKTAALVILLTVAMALLVGGGPALARDIACVGGRCRGTAASDVITGSDRRDVVFAGNGFDNVRTGFGNDELRGEAGDESGGDRALLFGDEGDDRIFGGFGDDKMEGEEGNDTLVGGPDDDFIDAAAGESPGSVDTVNCGTGVDEVLANASDQVAADCEQVRRVPDVTAATAAQSAQAADAEQAQARAEFRQRRAAERQAAER